MPKQIHAKQTSFPIERFERVDLLTNGTETFLVTKIKDFDTHLLYRLRLEDYGFMFYGKHTKFQLGLKDGKPLSEQPFGNLGSSVDLSGRKSSSLTTPRCFVFASGKNPIALKCPVYTQMRECHTQDLTKFIRGFSPEQRDVPYAAISTSSLAVAGQGEDLYLNTLFFMSNGTEY